MLHKLDYFILSIIFIAGLFLFMFVGAVPHYQRNVIYAVSGSYFLWSLWHHYRLGDLSVSIIIEYLVMILLALVILSGTFL